MKSKKIAVVSPVGGSGKTFTAVNLAIATAKNGKEVLLADMDFRNPSINGIFGFSKKEKGITDLLRESADSSEVVKNITDLLISGVLKYKDGDLGGLDGMEIVLSGTKVENPIRILEQDKVKALMKKLMFKNRNVIMDTSALDKYSDALRIVGSSDAVVIVAREAKTTYHSVEQIIEKIKKAGGNPVVMVLNCV